MVLISNIKKKGELFGELEKIVMEELWKTGEGTVREVLKKIKDNRNLAYTTVMTVMARMVEKGYLKRKELPNGSFAYKPRYNRENFYAKAGRALFGEFIKNSGSIAVAQFVDALEEVDPKQISELRKQLNRKKR